MCGVCQSKGATTEFVLTAVMGRHETTHIQVLCFRNSQLLVKPLEFCICLARVVTLIAFVNVVFFFFFFSEPVK
jgi:hypothetical protein